MVTAVMLLLMKIMTITKINFDRALVMCQARCSVLDLRYCILPKHFYSVPRSHDWSIIAHTLTGVLVINFGHFTAYWSSRIPSVFWGILLYISKQHFNHIYMYTCMYLYIYIIWLLYTYMYIKNRVFKVLWHFEQHLPYSRKILGHREMASCPTNRYTRFLIERIFFTTFTGWIVQRGQVANVSGVLE